MTLTPISPPTEHVFMDCREIGPILARLGDKWSILVMVLLGDGPMRFNELRRRIDGISQKMLTTTVRGLERDGYLTRAVTPSIPPRVDYALTDLGREVLGPIRAMDDFARANFGRIAAARAAFDARAQKGAA